MDPHRQLSLVPYASDSREIVLRHGNAVVVYDPQSQQLTLQDKSRETAPLEDCPFCHRPLTDTYESTEDEEGPHAPGNDHGFVDPQYFRMLAHSTPGSRESSAAPSPLRPLAALRSGGSRDVSASSTGPPTGSSFVASVPAPQTTEHGISGSSFSPGYFKRFFVEKRELGRGGRGVVMLVEHLLDSVALGEFACKRIPVGNDHDWLAKVLIEVQLLQRLKHQNLVSYQHVWLEDAQLTSFGPSVPCVFILQQFCNSGDLHNYVINTEKQIPSTAEEMKKRHRRRSQGLPETPKELRDSRRLQLDEIFSFFRDITAGLSHLHAHDYIHRDLKPSNCLLHMEGHKITVLVSDFGEVQATTAKRSNTGATGTVSYCAPEVLRRTDGAFGNFTTKSDVFSLGMILFFMCFGRLPYVQADGVNEENEDLEKLREEILAWQGFNESSRLRQDLPDRLYKFLKRLLSLGPADRPSTEDILLGIKAGSGLEDSGATRGQQPAYDETRPRFSAVDLPASTHRQGGSSQLRNRSASRVRPGLSQLGRHGSSDDPATRVPPPRYSGTEAGNGASGPNLRLRRGTSQGAPNTTSTPPTPRLMLPPPPRALSSVVQAINHPNAVLSCRVACFVAKVFTLSYPCLPWSARPAALYPLLCLAALDLGILGSRWGQSLALLGLHVFLVAALSQWSCLCAGKVVVWEDF